MTRQPGKHRCRGFALAAGWMLLGGSSFPASEERKDGARPAERDAGAASPVQFRPAKWITLPEPPASTAIGDVTGDGLADLLVGDYLSGAPSGSVRLFTQLADGSLGGPMSYTIGGNPSVEGVSLRLADLNEDGILDVVAGALDGIAVFLADGVGGLRPVVLTPSRSYQAFAVLDVNGDGHLDVVAAIYSKRELWLFIGDGSGGLSPGNAIWSGRLVLDADMAAGDLNGDGSDDLALLPGAYTTNPRLFVFYRNVGGGFMLPPIEIALPTDSDAYSMALGCGDLDGNGRTDIFFAQAGQPLHPFYVVYQDGSGALSSVVEYACDDSQADVLVTDLDRDNRMDAVVLHEYNDVIGVYHQESDGRLTGEHPVPIGQNLSGGLSRTAVSSGDLDSDGCPDLAIANLAGGLGLLYSTTCAVPCTKAPLAVSQLRIVHAPGSLDAAATWLPVLGDHYDIWKVDAKTEIPDAKGPGGGPVSLACASTTPDCAMPGILAGLPGTVNHFQVRGSCGGAEGQ